MIYVIVLNWNGFSETKKCLDSLSTTNTKYKVVLIDNGSSNREGIRLQEMFEAVELISNRENRGFAAGVNQGLRFAFSQEDCQYIFVLNNDTYFRNSCVLDNLICFIEDKGDVLVSPTILTMGTNLVQNAGGAVSIGFGGSISQLKGCLYKESYNVSSPGYLSGCAIFGKAEVFKKAGLLYEPYFAYFEDIDYSVRARDLGIQLLVLDHVAIEHQHSSSTKHISILKQYLLLRNSYIFARRNLRGWKKYVFYHTCIIARVLFMLKSRSFPSIRFILSCINDGFSENLSHKYFKKN